MSELAAVTAPGLQAGDGSGRRPPGSASRPSASAYHVALIRSRLPRPHTLDGDPGAEDRLNASLAADNAPFERFLAVRTRFFDEELLSALQTGISQVVILGAGYDGRALRFRSPGVRFVELDLPATQADKLRRLRDLDIDTEHVDFAAADFTAECVPDVLAPTSYNRLSPAVFLCEGVLLYLPRHVVARLLAELRSGAASGSLLLVSFAIGKSASHPSVVRRNASGERRQSFYSPAEAAGLLRSCGWRPTRTDHPDHSRMRNTDIAMFVRAVASA